MIDAFDDQRFRHEIEALVLAICCILRYAPPDRRTMDTFIQQEIDIAAAGNHPGAPQSLHLDVMNRLVQALDDWRVRTAECDVSGPCG